MHILNFKKIIFFTFFSILNIYFINAFTNNIFKCKKNKIINLIHNIENINNFKKITNHYKNNNLILKSTISKNYNASRRTSNFKFFPREKIERILKEAKSYLGTPYRYGGQSRDGIDCSSFISKVFKAYNISLPRVSYKQAEKGFPIPIDKLQKGDLLFFSTKRVNKEKINHVGITIEKKGNNIFFIHASSSNGVIISQIKEPYWKMRFMMAKRILNKKIII